MPEISGIAHVELSVTDLDASSAWYCALFGANEVFRVQQPEQGLEACAVVIPGPRIVIAFTRHDGLDVTPFTPRRTGLDHVSFAVGDEAELSSWAARLDQLGIENSGLSDHGYAHAVTFSDPDGIALEFFCRGA
ncbi:MAG: VOC family protein [Tepidiformaceae bacterium]